MKCGYKGGGKVVGRNYKCEHIVYNLGSSNAAGYGGAENAHVDDADREFGASCGEFEEYLIEVEELRNLLVTFELEFRG